MFHCSDLPTSEPPDIQNQITMSKTIKPDLSTPQVHIDTVDSASIADDSRPTNFYIIGKAWCAGQIPNGKISERENFQMGQFQKGTISEFLGTRRSLSELWLRLLSCRW